MKKIIHCSQFAENECGLCCIAMICSYYGFYNSIAYYRNCTNVGRDGLSLLQIYNIFLKLGFNCKVYQSERIDEEMLTNGPLIIHLTSNHYVVILKQRKSIFLFDPNSNEKKKTTIDSINKKFSGYYVVVNPIKSVKYFINDRPNIFKKLQKYLNGVQKILSIIFLLSLISYLFSIFLPVQVSEILNAITDSDSVENILTKIVFILIFIFIFFGLSFIRNGLLVKLQTYLIKKINNEIIMKLFNITFSYFDNRSKGDILYRLSLTDRLQNAISYDFVNFLLAFSNSVVIMAYIIFSYPAIMKILIFICLIIIGITAIIIHTKLLKTQKESQEKNLQFKNSETELVNNMYQIRCENVQNYYQNNCQLTLEQYIDSFEKNQKNVQFNSLYLNMFFSYIPFLIVIIYAFLFNHQVGSIFVLYSIINTLFSQSFMAVSEINSLSLLSETFNYIDDIIDEKENDYIKEKKPIAFKCLKLENISFKYNDNSRDVLSGFSLEINKSDFIAIVGDSGSGKTTIIKLLTHLYEPRTGTILINGDDLKNNKVFNYSVAILPQYPLTINGTIKENLSMDLKNIEDDVFWECLATAHLKEEVNELPMKLDTVVSNSGTNFSGGQLQRLSLARELVKNPDVLIFDEALSSLEEEEEIAIYDYLKKMGKTLLVITHRKNVLKNCNNICVMNNGKLEQKGAYTELYGK